MPEQLLKNFAINILQKLEEKETPHGTLAIFSTANHGMVLTLNGQILYSESDSFFFHEMMTHPALFTHTKPKSIAIIGPHLGILPEIQKHERVSEILCVNDNALIDQALEKHFKKSAGTENDSRIKHFETDILEWLSNCDNNHIDLIFSTVPDAHFNVAHLKHYYRILKTDGIFVQPAQHSLFDIHELKPIYSNILQAGFADWQLVNFPQPSHPGGWRTTILSTKRLTFNRLREKDIYNRNFKTRYYNFDVHKAALVLPEFVRDALELKD